MTPKHIDLRQLIVIEDDPDDQLIIRKAFADLGLRLPVVFIRNGQEALNYFFHQKGHIRTACLVVLDLNLPDIYGLDLLKRLREDPLTRHIPVIMLTSSQRDEDIARSYHHGANSYICKEGSLERFYDKLACMAEFWLQYAQLPDPPRVSA